MMNTQRMTGEENTMVESGKVVTEVILEEVITMVVAMMEVEMVNEEKKALEVAIETTMDQIKNCWQCRLHSLRGLTLHSQVKRSKDDVFCLAKCRRIMRAVWKINLLILSNIDYIEPRIDQSLLRYLKRRRR